MSHHNAIYDSQELKVDFSDENFASRHSTFRSNTRTKETAEIQETSFGYNYINPVFKDDDGNPIKTSNWSTNGTPRVPRWSTSDSLKDAIASLEDLTNRLNSEDNISRVSNMSRGRYSEKSFKDDVEDIAFDTPPIDYPEDVWTEDNAILMRSDLLDHANSHLARTNSSQPDNVFVEKATFADGNALRDINEVNAPTSDERNSGVSIIEAATAF